MSDQEPCLICSTTHKAAPHDHLFIHQNCPRCGEFKLTIRTCAIIKKIAAEARVKISGWVSDQNRAGTVPTISVDVLERVSARSLPTFAERADRLLLEAVRGQKNWVIGSTLPSRDLLRQHIRRMLTKFTSLAGCWRIKIL